MSRAVQEITIDKEKTFSYLINKNYTIPEQIHHEIQETARSLAESGKDTMLVRWGNGMEKMLIDSFLSLRDKYPLRLIKITYGEDKYNKALSELAEGLVISLSEKQQTIEDFMLRNSSAVVCYISRADYKKSKLKKYAEEDPFLEVINLFIPTLKSIMEQDLYRLIDTGGFTPEEIAARLSDWDPRIPSSTFKKAREFSKVWDAFSQRYADEPEKLKEITVKLLSAMYYYSYMMGYQDSEQYRFKT